MSDLRRLRSRTARPHGSVSGAAALAVLLVLSGCRQVPQPQVHYDPARLAFSGERAHELQAEFVTRFPNRHSGTANNRAAVDWLRVRFTELGWTCAVDEWTVVNYSRPVPLRNLVCLLPGRSGREILVAAHHDQSPRTVQGADNDGSGISILLHLAEVLSAGPAPRHTLVFLSADAEEYGMLGTRRYIRTHPEPERILAGISLDNLGKKWSNGMDMSPIGQFRGYGPLWLQLMAREAARAAGDLWVPRVRSPVDQILGQAVPISFMDQGPMIAAGVPALGFATLYPDSARERSWETYHSPMDRLEYQSPGVLHQSGRIAEALLRELLARDTVPSESGPYVYSDADGTVLRGAPLWLLFVGLVGLFFSGAVATARRASPGPTSGVAALASAGRRALPHLLSLWLPLVGGVLLLYGLVATGLMDRYHLYPATARDPAIFHPRWPAVAVFLVGLAGFFAAGRRAARRWATARPAPRETKAFALAVVGLAALYVLAVNPFSLLFFVPLVAWFFIGHRAGAGRAVDGGLFLLGGLVVYLLFYFFGFVILRNDFAILWYLMMMFSIGMVGFPTALAITAVIAAGLSMVVRPAGVRAAPAGARGEEARGRVAAGSG